VDNEQSPNQAPTITPIQYDGQSGRLFEIWIINALLSIVTLGIYSFWGKTKLRRYIINSFSIQNERLEYSGTGKEIFLGFLKALPIYLLLVFGWVFMGPNPILIAIIGLFFFYIIFVAIMGAKKYQFSRIRWRGVRGRIAMSPFKSGGFLALKVLCDVVTLGLIIPITDIWFYRKITGVTYFGNAKMNFEGKGTALFLNHIITLLLVIPTFGISRLWYKAALARYQYNNTTVNGISFKATHTAGSLFKLHFINGLILLFTLGLGKPITFNRNFRFFSERVSILGDINTDNIRQSEEELKKSGEGLEGVFNLDQGAFG